MSSCVVRLTGALAIDGPVTVLRGVHGGEVSIVTLGADPATSARLFGSGARQQQPPAARLSATSVCMVRRRQAAEG
jgi:hypothetical protein